MDDIKNRFIEAMSRYGVNIDTANANIIADGKIHRLDAIGKRSLRNKHVFYTLHLDGVPSGCFGDHQLGIKTNWSFKPENELTEGERSILRQRIKEDTEQRQRDLELDRSEAIKLAERIISLSRRATMQHPYLKAKGLRPNRKSYVTHTRIEYMLPSEGVDKAIPRGMLFIPSYDAGGAITGGQQITFNGGKYFIKGSRKKGSYHPIGKISEPTGYLFICEGWATALRVHWCTGIPTVAAFDTSNLRNVATIMRSKYPDAKIVLIADNDRFSTVGDIENPGVHFATMAANEVDGRVIFPLFSSGDCDKTDFDDLAQLYGEDEVRRQIRDQLRRGNHGYGSS